MKIEGEGDFALWSWRFFFRVVSSLVYALVDGYSLCRIGENDIRRLDLDTSLEKTIAGGCVVSGSARRKTG